MGMLRFCKDIWDQPLSHHSRIISSLPLLSLPASTSNPFQNNGFCNSQKSRKMIAAISAAASYIHCQPPECEKHHKVIKQHRFLKKGVLLNRSNLYEYNLCPFLTYTQIRFISSTLKTFQQKATHYEVLGLSQSASQEEIREAFLSLSKKYHPDINSNDPSMHKKFVLINEAYSILSKPSSKQDYDVSLNADRYMRKHMNSSGYRGQSHGYGYSAEPGAQYHYKGHMYDDSDWSRYEQKSSEINRKLVKFYSMVVCVAGLIVTMILQYVNDIPDPNTLLLRRINKEDIKKYELIMASDQEGEVIYYYAVPSDDNPGSYVVTAFSKEWIDKEKDEYVWKELIMPNARRSFFNKKINESNYSLKKAKEN